MNVQIIPVTDFRKNTKKVLDEALNETLMIRRGDELFEVRYYGMIGRASGYEGETYNLNGTEVTPTFGTWANDHPSFGQPVIQANPFTVEQSKHKYDELLDDPTYTGPEDVA